MCKLYGKKSSTKNVTLMELIEDSAKRFPDKTALKCNGNHLTYPELVRAVGNLACILQKNGIGKESLVGIYMDRSEKMIVSILAVLQAGGAYVPLDPAHPADRNRYIIEKSHIGVVLSESIYESVFNSSASVLPVDRLWNDIISEQHEIPENLFGGTDQLAYVIFTSGSTGNPKGVEIQHEGMVNYLLSVSENLGLDESAIGLSVVTITFDISISEMFLPLINGGTLVVADKNTAKDGGLLAKLIHEEKINLCGFTPSTAYMLLDADINDLTGMKMLIGGEPWSISLAKDILKCGCSQLWNVYGPTETTIYSTMCRITEKDTAITIGQPIAQTDIYVLDNEMKPVEPGKEGTLYIGGIGVARGYFENEALTNERFIPNPIDPERGRIYNTGDVVRFNGGENIIYVGRSDFQVKVHGYRIELGEIEVALSKHPGVSQAVAVVVGEDKNAKIHAFIKQKEGNRLNGSEMKAHVDNLLPYYMVPNLYTFVEEFPMTANLKVDRKALMSLEMNSTEEAKEFIAPRNEFEEGIAEIWCQLLSLDQVSVCDDFLELGGHSLLANRLVNRINKSFGSSITLVEFFARPMTVEEMALLVEENLLADLSDEELAELLKEE